MGLASADAQALVSLGFWEVLGPCPWMLAFVQKCRTRSEGDQRCVCELLKKNYPVYREEEVGSMCDLRAFSGWDACLFNLVEACKGS